MHQAVLRTFAALITLAAVAANAQTTLRPGLSTRATAEVSLRPPAVQGQAAPAAVTIKIDYGQPHARGRLVVGALAADLDTVWRLGANDATALTTEVDLLIGGAVVPKGAYTLYARTSKTGAWQLIINTNPAQMGPEYHKDKNLASVDLQSRPLAAPVESFTVALVPAGDGSAKGDVRFMWGTREFWTTWSVK